MIKIKPVFIGILSILFIMGFVPSIIGQDANVDKAEIPLTEPSTPAHVNIFIHLGSVIVEGFNGKNVLVEAKVVALKKSNEKNEETLQKVKGMHIISNKSTGLTILEENNQVDIKIQTFEQAVDVVVKVPYKSSLKIKAFQYGKIEVSKVEGELDITHHEGPINLKDISGTVVAHTFNGVLTATFERVNLNKPMSFTTFNGDIDVTFPKDAKFNLKMKSDQGEVYSDFKLQIKTLPHEKNESKNKDGKYVVKFEKLIYGLLNGGGEEVSFKTFNGNIFIREKK